MWHTIVQVTKLRVIHYEARVYCGKERRHTFTAMSEAGVRTWLASQGVPFHRQQLLTVLKG